MDDIPETRYARRGESFIAYQVLGEGPLDVLFIRSAFNHVELQWEQPRFARFLRRLASLGRLIVFDPRGTGLSDPFLEGGGIPTFEDWADDALAVMDAASCERAAVVCVGGGTMRTIPFVAAHPERVSALVVCNGYARVSRTEGYPYGPTAEEVAQARAEREREFEQTGTDFLPLDDPELEGWSRRYRRYAAPPGLRSAILRVLPTADVRALLPAIRVSTLVIQHQESSTQSRFAVPEHGRYLAEHIEGASFVELPGVPPMEWAFPDPDAVAAEIERFLLGSHTPPEPDRVLATVLFTDIVDSTPANVRAGDKRWRETLDRLDRVVAEEVARFRGHVIKSTGDGHLATFDGPGRAIRCAKTLCARVGPLGLTLRSGLHTGEIELRGEDIGGVAVSIARRVCDTADDGSVFVSSAVPPLVAGSEIEFADRGTHELKGVPGTWQLFEVSS